MAKGCSNTGIAARLYLSGKTVEWYIHRIFEALSVPQDVGYNAGSARSSPTWPPESRPGLGSRGGLRRA